MAVKFEIKDQLARLLAQEDLIVEHKNVETASFDVDRRILVLPNWNRASETVYDLLVGHEVGHALYTPNEDFSNVKAPKSYLNVTEDARIEKLMKRRFPGLSKCFFRGYKELNDDDFFGIKDEDITKLSLIDRINLYFKGNLDIKFSSEEQQFVDMVSVLETFADACIAAEEIYKFTKEQKEMEKVDLPDQPELPMQSSGGGEFEQFEDNESGEVEDEDSQEVESSGQTQQTGGSSGADTIEEAITDTNLQEKIETLSGYNYGETIYIEVPEVRLEKILVPCKKVWNYYEMVSNVRKVEYKSQGYSYDPDQYYLDEYRQFKKSAQKEVNYLVKEFECRKSASAYARAATSRTGVLDTAKLHTYKFNEDLFKKVTVLPDGKNHGLIFVLDWSGSMQTVLKDTVKQLLNLVWFCRKVNIPFEVYAFTNEWFRNSDDPDIPHISYNDFIHQDMVPNQLIVNSFFSLLNFLSSKTSSKDFERHCENFYLLACNCIQYSRLSLSGTPLNESIICLHQLIPQFKKKYGVEKLNAIVLTDGEAQSIPYIVSYKTSSGQERIGTNSLSDRCVLRDRKLGRVYTEFSRFHGSTKTLLQNLCEKFPEVNLIGIRLASGTEIRRYLENEIPTSSDGYPNYEVVNKLMQQWKKDKSICVSSVGYTKFFGLSSSSLSNGTEFQVEDNATKSQIKRAFAKSLNSKKLNKKILSEFVEVIA